MHDFDGSGLHVTLCSFSQQPCSLEDTQRKILSAVKGAVKPGDRRWKLARNSDLPCTQMGTAVVLMLPRDSPTLQAVCKVVQDAGLVNAAQKWEAGWHMTLGYGTLDKIAVPQNRAKE